MTGAATVHAIPQYLKLLDLTGRGFVVLGAGQGIGEQAAHALGQAGATVMCVDNDAGRARKIAQDVGGYACRADVLARGDMERVFREAKEQLGAVTGIVDIVGIARIKPLSAFDDAAWSEQFDQVVRHAFLTLQIGAAAVKEAGGGTITFVGSLAGLRAVRDQVAYGTAKAALHHLVRTTASELARDRIRINAVAPGFIRTPRLEQLLAADQWQLIEQTIPLGRAAQPYEIAAPLLFLASELSSHITGQVLAVDGGVANQAALPVLEFGQAGSGTKS
jgi:NAD(P)-dependent dehydrogenase (short-subunit alcohol dehydrogenase family)